MNWRRTLTLRCLAILLPVLAAAAQAAGPPVFINEIHYDNTGTDTGEAVEIAGPAGTNLAGWSVVLYNGANSLSYGTIALSGTIPNQQAGFGTLSFAQPGIQNGSPDGLALVDAGSAVIEFLSYEGSFVAADGPANGMTSTDIGVSEAGSSAVGDSLQLAGTGTMGGDFAWAPSQPNTLGAVNTGQTFSVVTGPTDPVINEFVANHTGPDTQAFVEVFGDPSTDYSAFTVLEIEGDGSNAGVIDAVLPVGTTNAGGYWIDPEDMENGTLTILLVEGFTGSLLSDLDTDNNGSFDSTPWTRIVDGVATTDGGGSDQTYSSSVLGPFFDGNPGGAGGASRIPNGTDTDTAGDWLRNDFDGFGFPSFPGTPALGEAKNTPDAVNVAITVPTDPVGVCGDAATLIHDIQGSGLASLDVGSIREVEGVVVGDFQGSTGLNGFFVQEEDTDADANALTSEGIFVFDPANAVALNAGDVVRVRGTVAEFNGLTEIGNVQTVLDCNTTGTASASTVTLPVTDIDDFEPTEGMVVDFPQTLFASGNFTQARFGEVDLSVGGPQDNPTNVTSPGAAANALQDLNNRSRIQLDDGSNVQNPLPLPPYLGAGNTLRTGDSVAGVRGVLGYAFGLYEIHPTTAVSFARVNVRPGVPSIGGSIQVAAFNVFNYFTTIDNGSPICGPLGNQPCRGADTAPELTRQRDKLVTAISALDAEVVGLMEIENHPDDVPTADLVAGLDAATAPGTYDYIATGAVGSDAIRVALLYQPASVTPLGGFEVLDSSDDPLFDDTLNRPTLVQSFVENTTGAVFTVAVNHLKSKGSSCAGDPDIGDGQGNCNITRTNAAQAIVDFLATDPTGSGDSDYLVIGDLNTYAQEDPVVTIEAGGYTDLIEAFVGSGYAAGAYSFNFLSQSGYLIHGLSGWTMTPQVTGAAFWHVNADEPAGLDYNNFNQPGLYNPDQFRSSDHDPVLVGLSLVASADLSITKTDDADPVNAGDDLTYALTVSNAGPDAAVDVVVTDTLAAGEAFVSATNDTDWACSHSTGIVTCNYIGNGGVLLAGTSPPISIVVTVLPETRDDLINNANVVSSTPDPTPANNFTEEDTEVIAEADLRVTKSGGPFPVNAGENLSYTVEATNDGPSTAENMQIVDNVPANTTFVSATPSAGGACSTPTLGGSGAVVCTWGGSTAVGVTRTLALVVKILPSTPAGTVIKNTVTASSDTTDPNSANNSATDNKPVSTESNFDITKTDFPFDPVVAGQDIIIYKVTLTNNGPSNAQNVVATDTLPAGVTFIETNGCHEDPNADVPPISCGLGTIVGGTIAAGETVQFTVKVSVDPMTVGLITNTVRADWIDQTNCNVCVPNPRFVETTEDTTVESVADVSVTKTDDPDPVLEGDMLTYTITVTNDGPSDAQQVNVIDTLPPLDKVEFDETAGCDNDDGSVNALQEVDCDLGKVSAGTSEVFTIKVNVASDAGGMDVKNTVVANVSGGSDDPDLSNNMDMEFTRILTGIAFFNQPGSVLVAPFEIGSKTIFRLMNLGDDDVDVHLIRVCGAEKSFAGQGYCVASDKETSLTPMQTRIFDVENFFDVNAQTCPSGFLVAYAEDDSLGANQPISWNFLAGGVYFRDGGSGKLRAAGSRAVSIQSPQATGTAIGMGGVAPKLPFNGFDLRQLPTEYVTDFRATQGGGVQKRGSLLHLITLDIEAAAQNFPTNVALNWSNQGEVPFSGGLEYVCQVRVPLEDIPSGGGSFTAGNLGSQFGKLVVTPLGSDAVIGFIEEQENNRQTLRQLFHDDVPRSTTFIGR